MNLNDTFPKEPGAYLIYDANTDMTYVGATSNLHRRIITHNTALKTNTHFNNGLQKLYNDNNELTVIVAPLDSSEDAFAFEQSLLDEFYNSGLLTNKARDSSNALIGNKSRSGLPHTEETKTRMSESHLKRHETYIVSEETKTKRKESMKDYIISDETREKLRIASTGRFYSEETRKKISDARIGIQFSEAHKVKLSEKKVNPVSINGAVFRNFTTASKELGVTKRIVQHRCYSPNYPDWKKVEFN